LLFLRFSFVIWIFNNISQCLHFGLSEFTLGYTRLSIVVSILSFSVRSFRFRSKLFTKLLTDFTTVRYLRNSNRLVNGKKTVNATHRSYSYDKLWLIFFFKAKIHFLKPNLFMYINIQKWSFNVYSIFDILYDCDLLFFFSNH